MPQRKLAKIYAITGANGNVYIGSTSQKLSKRLDQHRYNARHPETRPQHTSVKLLEPLKISLISEFPKIKSKKNLVKKEAIVINKTKNVVNKRKK